MEPRSNLVPSGYIKQVVKKKYTASSKDKKDWINFTRQINNISPKEADFFQENIQINKAPKLDLHGFSLDEANKAVKKLVNESFSRGYKKILVVTGKGSRSKTIELLLFTLPQSVMKRPSLL